MCFSDTLRTSGGKKIQLAQCRQITTSLKTCWWLCLGSQVTSWERQHWNKLSMDCISVLTNKDTDVMSCMHKDPLSQLSLHRGVQSPESQTPKLATLHLRNAFHNDRQCLRGGPVYEGLHWGVIWLISIYLHTLNGFPAVSLLNTLWEGRVGGGGTAQGS